MDDRSQLFPLCPRLEAHARANFVGRRSELASLEHWFKLAAQGERQVVLLAGEPGIGKTSLALRFALGASSSGAAVLMGHSDENALLPYQPFVESLALWFSLCPSKEISRHLTRAVCMPLRRLMPSIAGQFWPNRDSETPEDGVDPPEGDRYLLLQAVTSLFFSISRCRPLVLLLEDLQWADRASLLLLRYIANAPEEAAIFILGTYRETDVDQGHPLFETLADLCRLEGTHRISLKGLCEEEVAQLMSGSRESSVASLPVVRAVRERTGGNPFLIKEVLGDRELDYLSVGQSWGTPEQEVLGVSERARDTILRRLSRLSADCSSFLAFAAVIGQEFSFNLLEEGNVLPEDRLLAALEEATRAGLIESVHGSPDLYRFCHGLLRETMYEQLSPARRVRLHRRIADVLEGSCALPARMRLSYLAFHYLRGIFGGSNTAKAVHKAIHYAMQAAHEARDVFAYEEAVRLYRMALQAVGPAQQQPDKKLRYDLLLQMGDVLRVAGTPQETIDAIAPEALELAEEMGDTSQKSAACWLALKSHSVYGVHTIWGTPSYQRWAELASRYAQKGTVEEVYADLAQASVSFGKGAFGEAWLKNVRALNLARGLSDQEAILRSAMQALGSPGIPPKFYRERLRLAKEFVPWSFADPEPDYIHTSYWIICWAAWLVFTDWGYRDHAEETWRRLSNAKLRMSYPYSVINMLAIDIVLATMAGELERAVRTSEHLIQEASTIGCPLLGYDFALFTTRALLYLGRYEEALTALPRGGRSIGVEGDAPLIKAQRALILAQLNMRTEASQALREALSLVNDADMRRNGSVGILTYLLETSILVGDCSIAALLLETLSAMSSLLLAETSMTCVGRHLGAACELLGTYDKARRYYEETLHLASQGRFRPEAALTRHRLAKLLLEHYPRERSTGDEELRRAAAELKAMNMQPAYQALRASVDIGKPGKRHTVADNPDDLSAREIEVLELLATGATNREIATKLGISTNTVQRHVSNLLDKTGVANRTRAAAYCWEHPKLKELIA